MTDKETKTNPGEGNDEAVRVREVSRQLERLRIAASPPSADVGWAPAWSSAVLEAIVSGAVSAPGGRISDLFRALWDILADTEAQLTKTMSHFLRDIVVLCFTQYRSQYDESELSWMAASTIRGCSESQGYLALHALPDLHARGCKEAILSALKDSEFYEEAQLMLSEV